MDLAAYQTAAMRTSNNDHDRIKNGALGLIGETGEIVDIIKKFLFQSGENAPLPMEELQKECGDVLWYIAETCTGIGVSMHMALDYIHTFGHASTCMEECAITMMENALDIYHFSQMSGSKMLILRRLSDLYLHLVMLCNYTGLRMDAVAEANIKKLEKRYPTGFDPARSLYRAEYARREADENAKPAEDTV